MSIVIRNGSVVAADPTCLVGRAISPAYGADVLLHTRLEVAEVVR